MNHLCTHILYVITDLELGGVPLHLHHLAHAMRGRGFQPLVVSLARPGPVARMLREDGIEVRSCNGRGGWDFRVIGRLARIIKETKPDIVHALLFHANLAARLAARWAGFPREQVLCEIQTAEVERRWHLLVDRWTHHACRFIVGNSPSVVEHLATHGGIPRDRLKLVPGGIDPAPLQTAAPIDRSLFGLSDDVSIVLWVGRLDSAKGLVTLIRALELLVVDTNTHLLLAGDGPLRTRLVRQIERSGLRGRIHLLGARDDVPGLLKAADVFAFPSRTEGLPNALLEAMAAGCAIVTTDVPGCRDLIEHERTGLVVPYGDTRALANSIRRLLRDRNMAFKLGRRATQVVTEGWHIERTYDAYTALYDTICIDP